MDFAQTRRTSDAASHERGLIELTTLPPTEIPGENSRPMSKCLVRRYLEAVLELGRGACASKLNSSAWQWARSLVARTDAAA
jgi:hypothetical protein